MSKGVLAASSHPTIAEIETRPAEKHAGNLTLHKRLQPAASIVLIETRTTGVRRGPNSIGSAIQTHPTHQGQKAAKKGRNHTVMAGNSCGIPSGDLPRTGNQDPAWESRQATDNRRSRHRRVQ